MLFSLSSSSRYKIRDDPPCRGTATRLPILLEKTSPSPPPPPLAKSKPGFFGFFLLPLVSWTVCRLPLHTRAFFAAFSIAFAKNRELRWVMPRRETRKEESFRHDLLSQIFIVSYPNESEHFFAHVITVIWEYRIKTRPTRDCWKTG